MQPEQFLSLNPEESHELIKKEIDQLYHRKEIELPVHVGLSHFMPEHNGVARYNREGLADWANRRFGTSLTVEQIESKSKADITKILMEISAQYFGRGEQAAKRLEELLDAAYGPRSHRRTFPKWNRRLASSRSSHQSSAARRNWPIGPIRNMDSNLVPEALAKSDRDTLEREIRNSFEHKYRYEIHSAANAASRWKRSTPPGKSICTSWIN